MDFGSIKTASLFIPWLNLNITINPVTIFTTWGICLFMLTIAAIVSLRLQKFPCKLQAFVEIIYESFHALVVDTIGKGGEKFVPYILTIFLFVLLSNWISSIPGFESPTADLNTTLGLGLIAFFVAHGSAISYKGLKEYLKGYLEPIPVFLPLNIISELGKLLSHSFRLFGNIYAGGIVVALIPYIVLKLLGYWSIPFLVIFMPGLKAFFEVFVGGVQAFVFALLAAAYISVLR